MNGERRIARIVTAPTVSEGEGFLVNRPFPRADLDQVDPFLMLDQMGPADHGPGEARGTAPHPHRGFETLTYVLEGGLRHRDSLGNTGHVRDGGVQQMTAGAGLVHEEKPDETLMQDGGRLHAVQIWINLDRAHKMMPPAYLDVQGGDIPQVPLDGRTALVRVITGELEGLRSPVQTVNPTTILHVRLDADADIRLSLTPGWNAAVYMLGGSAVIADDTEPVAFRQMALLDSEGGSLRLCGHGAGGDILVLTGAPISEPLARYGPFVMNSVGEIKQAILDYQANRMGTIRPRNAARHDHKSVRPG